MAWNYYLSEIAYTHLVDLAKEQGFIHRKNVNAVGISVFLERLSFSNFEDTRPTFAIDLHRQQIARERQPQWRLEGEDKISRFFSLSNEAMINYVESAIKLEVIITRRLANGGQAKQTLINVTGLMLEAIGLEWATPTEMPIGNYSTKIEKPIRSTKKTAPNRLDPENPYVAYTRRQLRSGRLATTDSE